MIFIIKFKQSSRGIVIRNGKIVWKLGPYCWYFPLNLTYLGWPYRAYTKTGKNGNICEELLSKNDFEAVLATSCCYDHDFKASEAVQKIATDRKEYRKCSLWFLICWIAKNYLSINNSEKWLVTRISSDVAKKAAEVAQKWSHNWPMVSFIHNGSEITTWTGHSFKTKAQNP